MDGSENQSRNIANGVILVAAVLAIIRIWIGMTIEPDKFQWVSLFKDLAHVYMGGLFVYANNQMYWYQGLKFWRPFTITPRWNLFHLMNWIEISVAMLSRT